jgi:hypothetical protein
MTGGCPVLAQPLQRALWPRARAVLSAFPATPMGEHAGPVHSGALEMGALWEPGATSGEGRQASPITQQLEVGQHGAHLADTEDNGELLLAWCTHQGKGGPLPLEGLVVEALDAAQGDGPGPA